jgi:hypothetical protein
VEGRVRVRARGELGIRTLPELSWNSNEDREIRIPLEILGPDGRLDLLLEPADADGLIGGTIERLALYRKSALFELSYLRGMGLVLLQSLIVLATTLAMSTFCSAPLSILLGILVFLVGSAHGALAEGLRAISIAIEEQERSGRSVGVAQDIHPTYAKASRLVTRAVLAVVPDFGHFDYSRWLLKDLQVSWREMGRAAGRALPSILVLALLGMAVMRVKGFEG